MGYGFNKINNMVLKFDIFKDSEKILFNHYIMRRENISRLNEKLGKNQFTLSIDIVSKDFNISRSKAYRLIKEFEEIGVIKMIVNGKNTRTYSIYEYITCDNSKDNSTTNSETGFEMETETNFKEYEKINKSSNTNVCMDFKNDKNNDLDKGFETDNEAPSKRDFEKSKKENIKRYLKKDNVYECVINYLNQKTSKNFKPTTNKTKSLINARIRDGFVEDDFYKVIDVKCNQWLYSDMKKYLRPETLFSNKFESYLNEVELKDINLNKDDSDIYEDKYEVWDIKFDY